MSKLASSSQPDGYPSLNQGRVKEITSLFDLVSREHALYESY